ncbi:hypothetical protein SAY86_007053 [Trapa natans]|uniref:Uncharacterized protein n=1 Tax=Trapa natans TaxID=22666 RepID=A0AAN7LDV9_TRANT|nr:hypothetical protein SAY86_007053 [Trapa natans]
MSSTGESEPSDFGIPEEILRYLPSNPYDLLELGCKITSLALSTRVSELESQCSALRAQLVERDALISELRSRVVSLDASLAAADIEKESLLKQNQSLHYIVQVLKGGVEKLEVVKNTLEESLPEDEPSFEGDPKIIAKPTTSDDDSRPPSRSSSVQSELSEMVNRSAEVRETEVPTQGIFHGLLSERTSPEFTPLHSPTKFYASTPLSLSSNLLLSRRHVMPFSNPGSLFDDQASVQSLSSTRGSLSGIETPSQTGRSPVDGRDLLRKARLGNQMTIL